MLGRGEDHADGLGEAQSRSASTLGEICRKPVVAHANEPLRAAVHRMAHTGRTRMPVVSTAGASRIVGEVTLEDMLKAQGRHLEEEQRRERVLPLESVIPPWIRNASAGARSRMRSG